MTDNRWMQHCSISATVLSRIKTKTAVAAATSDYILLLMLILASRHFALLWSSRSLTPFSRLTISSWIGFCAFNCFTCAQPANGRRHSRVSERINNNSNNPSYCSGNCTPRVEQFSWYSDCWNADIIFGTTSRTELNDAKASAYH